MSENNRKPRRSVPTHLLKIARECFGRAFARSLRGLSEVEARWRLHDAALNAERPYRTFTTAVVDARLNVVDLR